MKPVVCIIDDDLSVQRALRRFLQSAGYCVEVFSSANEFLSLTGPHPACLLVDLRMPGMTGIDLQIALSASGRDIPVIMMSGHADAATILRATTAGAAAFLCKPFEGEALLEAVQQATAKHREKRPPKTPQPVQKNG